MSEYHIKLGDILITPDGERWHVTQDDSSHLFWLSSKPRLEDSRESMPIIPDVQGRLS